MSLRSTSFYPSPRILRPPRTPDETRFDAACAKLLAGAKKVEGKLVLPAKAQFVELAGVRGGQGAEVRDGISWSEGLYAVRIDGKVYGARTSTSWGGIMGGFRRSVEWYELPARPDTVALLEGAARRELPFALTGPSQNVRPRTSARRSRATSPT